jgi:hypothetical protein
VAENIGIVIQGSIPAGPAVGWLPAINLVSVVKLVAAGADRYFKPAIAVLVALEKGAVGARDSGSL